MKMNQAKPELTRYTKFSEFTTMIRSRGLNPQDFVHECDEQCSSCHCQGIDHVRGDQSCPDMQKHDVCLHDLKRWYELTGDPTPRWKMKVIGVAHVYRYVEQEGIDLDDAVEKAENKYQETLDDWIVDELKDGRDGVYVMQNSWKRIVNG